MRGIWFCAACRRECATPPAYEDDHDALCDICYAVLTYDVFIALPQGTDMHVTVARDESDMLVIADEHYEPFMRTPQNRRLSAGLSAGDGYEL